MKFSAILGWFALSASSSTGQLIDSGGFVIEEGNATISTPSGVYTRVLGQSGKIMVGATENPADDPNRVVIEFDALTEVDAEGNAVGTSGSTKHSFNTFATQDFVFGNVYETELGTAKASAFDFSCTLLDQANLTVTVFMITESGEFELNEFETLNLTSGSMKFNVDISNWPFCEENGSGNTLCQKGSSQEIGEFLDLDITIKGSGNAVQEETNKSDFALGSGVSLTLSDSVQLDGNWTSMPQGYPLLSAKGGKETFTFRFAKFATSAFYDPVVSGFTTVDDGGDGSSTVSGGNETLSFSGIHAKVLGQSGKIVFGTTENPSEDPNAVTVELSGMYEKDASGSNVGSSGSSKHSFNSFASQEFVFGDVYNTKLGEVDAYAVDFNSTLVGGSKVIVTMFLTTKAGVYTLNDAESFTLSVGSLKFNVAIEDWPFCTVGGSGDTLCQSGNTEQEGKFLDLEINIKGKGEGSKVNGKEKSYVLGEGVQMDLSGQVEIDGEWVEMPAGYPSMTTSGSKQVFVFRFPRFSKKAMYDPIISLTGSTEQPTLSTGAHTGIPAMCLAILLVLASFLY